MLLTLYTLNAFRRFFFLALSSFTGLYLLIEFFDKVDNFTKHSATSNLYLTYFLCKIPLIVTQTVPLAVLLGVFLTIGNFSQSNELTAMRAGGMSLMRISLPLLASGLLITLLVIVAAEWLVPITTRRANQVYEVELGGVKNLKVSKDKIWLRDGNAIVNIRLVLPEQQTMQGVVIQEVTRENRLLRRIDARRADYRNGAWQAQGVAVTDFDPATGELLKVNYPPTLPLPLQKTPDDFKKTVGRNEEMGIRELAALNRRIDSEGYDSTRYRVDLQGRFALPFASFVMAFIGIPFALQQGRGASLAVGIAVSVAIGVSYHLLQGTLLALGYSGALPVLLAAWGPNLAFGLLGLWLLLRTR